MRCNCKTKITSWRKGRQRWSVIPAMLKSLVCKSAKVMATGAEGVMGSTSGLPKLLRTLFLSNLADLGVVKMPNRATIYK